MQVCDDDESEPSFFIRHDAGASRGARVERREFADGLEYPFPGLGIPPQAESPRAGGPLLGSPPDGGGKEPNRLPELIPMGGPGRHAPSDRCGRLRRSRIWTGSR